MTAPTLGDAREDLATIVTLTGHLLDQAIHGGHDGHLDAAAEIPGREAMIMLGPAANYEAWAHQTTTRIRVEHAQATREHRKVRVVWLDDLEADLDPPTLVLTAWEDMWREHLATFDTTRVQVRSLTRSAAYLNQHMTRMSTLTRPSFDNFTTDLHQLRARLETVLHDGERDEKGAPCVHCRTILVRRTDPPAPAPARYCRGHDGICRWPDRADCCLPDRGGLRDMWDCPRCNRSYNAAEYWNAVAAGYRANAPALTAGDMAAQLGITAGTLRVWAHRGKVRRRGRDLAGRVLYDVADTRHAATTAASPNGETTVISGHTNRALKPATPDSPASDSTLSGASS